MNDVGNCANCGGDEWVVDYHSGFSSCTRCGCCAEDRIMVVSESYRDTFREDGDRRHDARVSETYPDGAIVTTMAAEQAYLALGKASNSPPYKRQTYFSERVSQWRMLEPAIDPADLALIVDEWRKCTGYFGRAEWANPEFPVGEWGVGDDGRPAWRCDYVLTKDDCRRLLWRVDNEVQRSMISYKPYFVKKYLEKYFSIRKELCGVDSFGAQAEDNLIIFLREMFAKLQVPFEIIVRMQGKRYSFPNYNFCLRRLLDLYGRSDYCLDFPPLKSKKKREDIIMMWLQLITYLKWVSFANSLKLSEN